MRVDLQVSALIQYQLPFKVKVLGFHNGCGDLSLNGAQQFLTDCLLLEISDHENICKLPTTHFIILQC